MNSASPIESLRRLASLAAAGGADAHEIQRSADVLFVALAAVDLARLQALQLTARVQEANRQMLAAGTADRIESLGRRFRISRAAVYRHLGKSQGGETNLVYGSVP